MIDLHMHSTFSDGSCSPEELVALASEAGLSAMALTDHDTVDGVPGLRKAAQKCGIEVISGLELASDFKQGEMHFLGYGVGIREEVLHEHLHWIQGGRNARNKEILRKLNQLGMRLSWGDVLEEAGSENVGRLHFAMAMKNKGFVKNKKEAFRRFLTPGRAAYAPRRNLTPVGCIDLILESGGVPVLAHPFTIDRNLKKVHGYVKELAEKGLQGLEVFYPHFTHEQHRVFVHMAKEFNLVQTGGTDFHGEGTPDIKVGKGRGHFKVPDKLFKNLLDRKAERTNK